MEAYVLDWLNLLVRWLHLITGIAWIGASFYFVMLDNSLSPPAKPEDAKRGVFGELWAVHGGGFYVSRNSPSVRRASSRRICTGRSGRRTRRGCRGWACSR
jgi:uncharacterized membrane protein